MKTLLNKILVLLLFVILFNSCKTKQYEKTEILWDTWGVPHIFAQNAKELFYSFGWAQMHSHGNLILKLYGEARGRAAEYWGESYLQQDEYIHTAGIPSLANTWLEAQDADLKSYAEAFINGMNAYAEANGKLLSEEVKVVLPVRVEDVLAHVIRVIHFTFVGGEAQYGAQRWNRPGSNAWAIGPTKSASGNAMLIANPHLPWSGFFTWYEAQLTAPELNAYGATLVGMPILAICFNDHLGWTHTNNTFDGMDLYELTLTQNGYLWDGGEKVFEEEIKSLKIKQEDGSFREQEFKVLKSIHGPIISKKEGKVLAMRLVGLDQSQLFRQYWDMMHSTSLNEFENIISRLQMPFFNIIYADKDGHIMYLFGGRTPKRPGGDWSFWRGIIPGDTSATLWTETHSYEDLPKVIDPPCGWVQNANDPPWTSTLPMQLDPEDFPSYMAPQGMSFRPQRSARMLLEDDQITFDELIEYKHSTYMELADRILGELIQAIRQNEDESIQHAGDVLENWDRKADKDSRGAVLFSAWVDEIGFGMFAKPWDAKDPGNTPKGLANPSAAIQALKIAIEKVIDAYGAIDVPWGEVNRLKFADKDLPANGGPGYLGIFRVLGLVLEKDGKFQSVSGDSYVAAIEFGKKVRAKTLISYGNSSQPESPHVGDQLELFSKKELRPVWRTREEIEANLEKREIFEDGKFINIFQDSDIYYLIRKQ